MFLGSIKRPRSSASTCDSPSAARSAGQEPALGLDPRDRRRRPTQPPRARRQHRSRFRLKCWIVGPVRSNPSCQRTLASPQMTLPSPDRHRDPGEGRGSNSGRAPPQPNRDVKHYENCAPAHEPFHVTLTPKTVTKTAIVSDLRKTCNTKILFLINFIFLTNMRIFRIFS